VQEKNTIAVVVVTFNRKKLLAENIAALLQQTLLPDKIYIVNNQSTDGTEFLLQSLGYLQHPLIRYILLEKNIGGAGGFYEGMKAAYDDGYEWIWVMDDDAEPTPTALEKLIKTQGALTQTHVGILASTVVLPNKGICYVHRRRFDQRYLKEIPCPNSEYQKEYFEIDIISFVGTLIRRDVIQEVGLPAKEYFISFDDTEYSLRVREKLWTILNVSESVILHKVQAPAQSTRRIALGRKYYFESRNYIDMLRRHKTLSVMFCSFVTRK
jgi:GT2 family glycosyltransferase